MYLQVPTAQYRTKEMPAFSPSLMLTNLQGVPCLGGACWVAWRCLEQVPRRSWSPCGIAGCFGPNQASRVDLHMGWSERD